MEKIQVSNNIIFKILIFTLGMFTCCIGIALTIRSDLGSTPIAAPAYIPSLLTPLSFGMTTFIVNALFLTGQIFILRRKFPPIQLIQLPISFLLGVFMDLSMFLTQSIHSGAYWWNIFLVLAGSLILGLGVALEIYAKLTYLPGDGLVNVIFETTGWNFGKIKVSFDSILVVIAVIMSYAGLHKIAGLREGTLISALTVGFFADMFLRIMQYKKEDS